MDKIPFLKQKN